MPQPSPLPATTLAAFLALLPTLPDETRALVRRLMHQGRYVQAGIVAGALA